MCESLLHIIANMYINYSFFTFMLCKLLGHVNFSALTQHFFTFKLNTDPCVTEGLIGS